MKYLLNIILICAFSMMASCWHAKQKQANDDRNESFYWSPGVGAAHLYPMELYRCAFIYADGKGVSPGPVNLTNGSWGEENGASVVGDEYKPIHVSLDISWLSYTENKFYQGHFKLPDSKILSLFKQGFMEMVWDEEKGFRLRKNTYNNIIAGLAPGGVVVVWLSGAGFEVEVGRFQAEVTTVNMNDFAPAVSQSQEAYVKRMMTIYTDARNNVEKNGIAFGLWDKYRVRFYQQPIVKYNHVGRTDRIQTGANHLKYDNGEQEYIYAGKLIKPEIRQRAMVKEMRVEWTDTINGRPKGYVLEVKFDEAEMFKAYKKVYGDNPGQPGQLVTEINAGNFSYRIFLQAGDKKAELLKQTGNILYEKE